MALWLPDTYVLLFCSRGRNSKLDAVTELKVAQRTPLRVAHRRTGIVREKVIHSMSSELISSRIFILDMDTSAGTYVKEFVHGDLGAIQRPVHSRTDVREVLTQTVCRQGGPIRTLDPCSACPLTYCSLMFLASNTRCSASVLWCGIHRTTVANQRHWHFAMQCSCTPL